MDVMRARVELRERPLLDVLDLSVRFCAEHAWPYVRLSMVVLLPSFVASWLAARFASWWAGWVVALVLSSVASAPFVALASRLVFADQVKVREALGLALRGTPKLLLLRFLQWVGMAASVLMVGAPWLWVGTVTLFTVEVLVLEQAELDTALARAMRIANAHFGPALLAMLILGLAPLLTAVLADLAGREALQSILEVKPPPSMFHAGWSWLALAGWWAVMPLTATAHFFVYLDVRTRTEGWDIQTRFAEIAARSLEQERPA